MQIRIQKVQANIVLPYAMQEAKRRRLTLVMCRFQGRYAYILMKPEQAQRIQGRFTVVVESSEKIPLAKQHKQLQTTGQYQTHRAERRNYRATTVENTVRMASLYISTM